MSRSSLRVVAIIAALTLAAGVRVGEGFCRGWSRASAGAGPSPSAGDASLREVLAQGGIYPVVFPHGWKLVNLDGKEEDFAPRAGAPFHRVVAQGALMAKENDPTDGRSRELVIFTALHEPPPITEAMLDEYAAYVVKQSRENGVPARVGERRIFERAKHPAAKVVIERDSTDGRIAVDYLLEDEKHEVWQLSYLVRRDELARWQPMFAEIERPPAEAPTE